MTWTQFLQANSQYLLALGGVIVGSLLTLLGTFINNRFQAVEKDKDRKERQREAKTELAIELTRNDINILEDAIDNTLRAVALIWDIRLRKDTGKLTKPQMLDEITSAFLNDDGKIHRLSERDSISKKLAYGLGEKFYGEYMIFHDLWKPYARFVLDAPSRLSFAEDMPDPDAHFVKVAGRLHTMLKEKLLAIRDSQS